MWNGWKPKKSINLGGRRTAASRNEVLRKARQLRDARENLRKQEVAATCLQRVWRSFQDLSRTKNKMRKSWDAAFGKIRTVQRLFAARKIKFIVPAASLLPLLRQLGFFFCARDKQDLGRLELFAPILQDNLHNAKKGHNIGKMVVAATDTPLSADARAPPSASPLFWSWCLLSHRFIMCCTAGIHAMLSVQVKDGSPDKVLVRAGQLLVAAQAVGTLESAATPLNPETSSLILHFFMRCCMSSSLAPAADRARRNVARQQISLFSLTAAIMSLYDLVQHSHQGALDALAARVCDMCAVALLLKSPGRPSKLLHSKVRVSKAIMERVSMDFVEHLMAIPTAMYHCCRSARELLVRVARTRPCFIHCMHALSNPGLFAHNPTKATDALATLLLCREHVRHVPPRGGDSALPPSPPQRQLHSRKEAALTARACVNLMRLGATHTATTTTLPVPATRVTATANGSDDSDSDGDDDSMFGRQQGGEKFGVEGVRRATVRWIREKPDLLQAPLTTRTKSPLRTACSVSTPNITPAAKRSRHSKTVASWVSITHHTMTDWGEGGAGASVDIAAKWPAPSPATAKGLQARQDRNLESLCGSDFLCNIASPFHSQSDTVTAATKATGALTVTQRSRNVKGAAAAAATTLMASVGGAEKTQEQSLWMAVASLHSELLVQAAQRRWPSHARCRDFNAQQLQQHPQLILLSRTNTRDGNAARTYDKLMASLAFPTLPVGPPFAMMWSRLLKSGFAHRYAREQDWAMQHPDVGAAIGVCLKSYSHLLCILDDTEFHVNQFPFRITTEVIPTVRLLSDFLWRTIWRSGRYNTAAKPKDWFGTSAKAAPGVVIPPGSLSAQEYCLIPTACQLFNQLHDRNVRQSFLSAEKWRWSGIHHSAFVQAANIANEMHAAKAEGSSWGSLASPYLVISTIPQVTSFMLRTELLYKALADERDRYQSPNIFGERIKIRRDFIFEDAFSGFRTLMSTGGVAALKGKIKVEFYDEHGRLEPGVDGGGLFKEFMDVLTSSAFDPRFALFKLTANDKLTPHPSSSFTSVDHLEQFEFLGMVLGKAMFENILVAPVFANTFLNLILGKRNLTDDLVSLDPELHKQLLSLKTLDDDIEDLDLTFEIRTKYFGQVTVTELIPGGSSIPVTRSNMLRYIARVADYKLNRECRRQCRAFLRGLRLLVPETLMHMFSPSELQLLLGGFARAIDIDDLRKHARLQTWHHGDTALEWFWEVLAELTVEQQAKFLKFVTSCPRAPLTGFKQLYPPFTISRVNIRRDSERLPTAATCMNLFKLPTYSSKSVMRQKLLISIEANAGFEMS